MSQENVELTYRAVDAFNRRDWDAFVALVDGAVDVESRLALMEGGYHSHEGMRRWWDNLIDAMPDYTVHPSEVRDHGELTLMRFRGEAHGAASSAPVIDDAWQVTRWRGGKILWWRNCATEAEALEAMGRTE